MSLKFVVQSLKAGDVALFPSKEREHATTSLQHATTTATPNATNHSNAANIQGGMCNTPCNSDATTPQKPCNKYPVLKSHFVASKIVRVALVWHFLIEGKRITAIDHEHLSQLEMQAYLDSKFGSGRVTQLNNHSENQKS